MKLDEGELIVQHPSIRFVGNGDSLNTVRKEDGQSFRSLFAILPNINGQRVNHLQI